MKDDIGALFKFNRWADKLVLEACRKLSPEQYVAEPAPGWSSVRSTVYHIAVVTNAWTRVLTGEDVSAWSEEDQFPTVGEAEKLLAESYTLFEKELLPLSPEQLEAPRLLRGRGRELNLPPWIIRRHIVNHSSYHRGQIASKLGRLGAAVPTTDFLRYALENASG